MSLIDRLWQPSVKDVASQLAPQVLNTTFELQNAGAVVTLGLPFPFLPADRVALVKHWHARQNCGGGELTTQISVYIADQADTSIPLARIFDTGDVSGAVPQGWKDFVGNPPDDVSVDEDCDIVVMPGQVLVCQLTKNAAIVAALRSFSLHGVIVPRGNWQR